MENKYINNGVLHTEYFEGHNIITIRFEGWYYNTNIVNIYFYFDKENPHESYTSFAIRDGGYRSSPYTTKAMTKFIDLACEWVDNDFGDSYINDCMIYAYHAISDIYEVYRNKYRKCNGECLTEITYHGRYYPGHFNFNF